MKSALTPRLSADDRYVEPRARKRPVDIRPDPNDSRSAPRARLVDVNADAVSDWTVPFGARGIREHGTRVRELVPPAHVVGRPTRPLRHVNSVAAADHAAVLVYKGPVSD